MKSAKKTIALAAAMLLAATGLGLAQNYRIDWYTTDSGGGLKTDSVDGQWQVSGTAGQWDATEPRANTVPHRARWLPLPSRPGLSDFYKTRPRSGVQA